LAPTSTQTPYPTETTRDALFDGAVTLFQPKRGYRVNVDSVHLATFAARKVARRVCDLGAGVGAVGLSLLHLGAARSVTFVELDATAVRLLERNIAENDATGEVVATDVRNYRPTARFDLVVANPPYFAAGRVSPEPSRRQARSGSLRDFVGAAARILAPQGRVAFAYPARELSGLLACLRAHELEPKLLQCVHGRMDRVARIVLVSARRAKAGGLDILPPLQG
jgi:tRNA1Val (adenine37-N6)-methyltransferase